MKTVNVKQEFMIPGTNVVVEKGDTLKIKVRENLIKEQRIRDFVLNTVVPATQKAFPELRSILSGRETILKRGISRVFMFDVNIPRELSSFFKALSMEIDISPTIGRSEVRGSIKFSYTYPGKSLGGGSDSFLIGDWRVDEDLNFGIYIRANNAWAEKKLLDPNDPTLLSFTDF